MKISQILLFILSFAALYGCGSGSRPSEPLRTGFTSAMVVSGDTLFTLDSNKVGIFNIRDEARPASLTPIPASGKASILVHQGHLYAVDKNGSSIWNVQDPASPVAVGADEDLRGCGQMITEDLTGYSVLHWNRHCNEPVNRLDIIDFADPRNPEKVAEYTLSSPVGLIKTPEYLAVCEKYNGVALLNIDDPQLVEEIARIPAHECSDITMGPETLIFRTWDGIYQYEVSGAEPELISSMPTGPSLD